MTFYHNLITKKSFEILKQLHKKYDFILIGGWAVFFYTKALKSKDIDIVIGYSELEKLAHEFELIKNNRLKKYEIKIDEIDIDIYLPHFSNPGLPAEEVFQYSNNVEGFRIVQPEVLLILKQHIYGERKDSPKGQKDKLDIFSLLKLREFNWKFYKRLLKKYNRQDLFNQLKELLKSTHELKEIGLNQHQMSRLKKDILSAIDS
jgi:hypothetical protein